jgi:hypothetical protein
MAITNHERVGKGLNLLKGGLGPFVDREFKSAYMDRAAAEASRSWARFAEHPATDCGLGCRRAAEADVGFLE